MVRKKNVFGEGNYEASKKYDDATLAFVKSGRVDAAARAAAPANEKDAAEMAAAEEAGKRRAKLPRRTTIMPDSSTKVLPDPLAGPKSRSR